MAGTVLLTGASGLLGYWLLETAPVDVEVVALTHRRGVSRVRSVRADLRDPAAVRAAVERVEPATIVHAAYDKDRVSIVEATSNVVEAATGVGVSVVFTSTDAVFDGDGLERDESATPDAVWDYGRWKATAEQVVLASDRATVVRLPLMTSFEPDDPAVAAIRAAANARQVSTWFSDELRRPALASDVAAALWRIASLPTGDRQGVWHLAGPERLSRYDIARRITARLGVDATTVESEPRPPDSVRPRDIAFTDARARAAIGWNPSPIG